MPSKTPTYYDVLGVLQSADAPTIKAAFQRRAKILHPDVPTTGDPEAFRQLLDARDVLLDHEKRRGYDAAIVAAEISGHDLGLAHRIFRGPRDRSLGSLADYLKDVQEGATIMGDTVVAIVDQVKRFKRRFLGS